MHAENIAFDKWPVNEERSEHSEGKRSFFFVASFWTGVRGNIDGMSVAEGPRNWSAKLHRLTNGRHHHHQHELKWAQAQNSDWNSEPGYMYVLYTPKGIAHKMRICGVYLV